MKVILLGGGYGTRLERDLRSDESGHYSHLLGIPKPLLPIGNKPLATHWLSAINDIPAIDQVYVVTNASNHSQFVDWAKDWPIVKLVCDGTISNETRLGAVTCMKLPVEQFNIQDDTIIIAGDTLLYDDFNLASYIQKFEDLKEKDSTASMLVYVTCSDDEVHKYGILETNSDGRVNGFLEKPQPQDTASRKECPCFYFLNKHILPVLGQYLDTKKDAPLRARDLTGNFIVYLYERHPVYASEISGRFDVGGLQSYILCHQHFLSDR